MHTAHLLPVSPSMHCAGGGCLLPGGFNCLWSGGYLPLVGEGWFILACNVAEPPVNRMTDRCKNITLPQTSFAGGKYCELLDKILHL